MSHATTKTMSTSHLPPAAATNDLQEQELQRILTMPAFIELRRKRGQLARWLSVAMLCIYYGFVMLIAFTPATLATPVFGVISLGIVLGLVVIGSAIALTSIYVWIANRDFDPLVLEIARSAK